MNYSNYFNFLQIQIDIQLLHRRQMNQSLRNLIQQETNEFMLNKQIFTFEQFKKKDLTCIEIFGSTLYVGTKELRVQVFQILHEKQQEKQIKQSNRSSNTSIQLVKLRHFYPHCDSVHSIIASQKYLIVVPLKGEQLIRIWDRKSLSILHGCKGHNTQISQVIFLKGEKHIVSIGEDGTARVWPLDDKFQYNKEYRKYDNKYPILTVIELNQTTVVFGGDDCYITFWSWEDDIVPYRQFAHPGSLSCLSLNYPHILSVGGDSKIKVWQIKEEEQNNLGNLIAFALLNPIEEIKNKTKLSIKMLKNQSIQSNVCQECFAIKLNHHRDVMVIDSKGKILLINTKFNYKASNLQLEYNETLRSIKVEKNYMFFVISKGNHGELKYCEMNCENLLGEEKQTDIKGQQVEQSNPLSGLLSMLRS